MLSTRQWSAAGLRRPLLQALPRASLAPRIAIRAASLSAIHRGLRQSEKVQYGGPRDREAPSSSRRSREPPFAAGRGRTRELPTGGRTRLGRDSGLTARALEGAGGARQQQKLKKKLRRKEEEKEDEEDDGPTSRRKRFLDPEFGFGKRSLVYQLKHGALKDTAKELTEPVRPQSFRSMDRDRRGQRDEPGDSPLQELRRQALRSVGREGPRRQDEGSERSPISRRDFRSDDRGSRGRDEPRDGRPMRRDDNRGRDAPGERGPGRRGDESGRGKPREYRPKLDDSGFESRRTDEADGMRARKRVMMPMTVKYTTAASQFLYGKAVVRAAFEQGRRKLYNLYIYGGDNRKDIKENAIMTRLAEQRGVPITIVPTEEQRIMDKMSMGRPHNGFVLETSPLPQLPVRSLGKLEETPFKLGFHVELDHQTKEEEAINGTDTFVPRVNDIKPKPFVLLLNEILDPGNLGAALRTASYLGVDAVGITNRGSSTLTPVVLKSAAGAVEEISIFTVDSPKDFIEESKKAGWKTYAAVPPPDVKLAKRHGGKFISMDTVEQSDPLSEGPCILMLGNEGHGLPKHLKVAADYELSIPRFVQNSCVDSLNVSVAAAMLCHSFVREPKVQEVAPIAEHETPEAEHSQEAQPEEEKVQEQVF